MPSRLFLRRWAPLGVRNHLNGDRGGCLNRIGQVGRLSTESAAAAAGGHGEKGRFRLIVDDYFLGVHLALVVVFCYYGYKTVAEWIRWEAKCHEYDQAIDFEIDGFTPVDEEGHD